MGDQKMLNRLVSFLFFLFVSATSIPFFIIAVLIRVITYPFDKRLRLLHLFTCFWGSLYTWLMPPWRIKVEGRKNIRRNAKYIVVSNHQSQLDILVAFRLFFHFKWVSKIEIFKVPLIGWNMLLNRYVKLKRGDKKSIREMMDVCAERIQEGSSIFMFPEGSRSMDGKVKDFKLGAFRLAKENKIPILPIVVSGTYKALPKYSVNFHGINRIIIKVFNEIPYSIFEKLSVEETAQMVREFIIEKLATINNLPIKDVSV
jgi:1-acyl-sn-glycerol-3-phosphate acyltransferase